MKYTKLTLSFLLLFSITVYSQDYNQTKKNIVKSIENHEEEEKNEDEDEANA